MGSEATWRLFVHRYFHYVLLLPITTVLQGYMLAKDGTTCIKTDATDKSGVVDSSGATGRTATELAKAKCTLLSVQDGDEAGML